MCMKCQKFFAFDHKSVRLKATVTWGSSPLRKHDILFHFFLLCFSSSLSPSLSLSLCSLSLLTFSYSNCLCFLSDSLSHSLPPVPTSEPPLLPPNLLFLPFLNFSAPPPTPISFVPRNQNLSFTLSVSRIVFPGECNWRERETEREIEQERR